MLAEPLAQAAAFAYLPYTTVWLQQVLGHGPVDAGLDAALLLAAALAVMAAVLVFVSLRGGAIRTSHSNVASDRRQTARHRPTTIAP